MPACRARAPSSLKLALTCGALHGVQRCVLPDNVVCAGGRAKPSQGDHHSLSTLQELWMLLVALLSLPGSSLGNTAYPPLAEAAARTCLLALTWMPSKPGSTVAQHHAAVTGPTEAEEVICDPSAA